MNSSKPKPAKQGADARYGVQPATCYGDISAGNDYLASRLGFEILLYLYLLSKILISELLPLNKLTDGSPDPLARYAQPAEY